MQLKCPQTKCHCNINCMVQPTLSLIFNQHQYLTTDYQNTRQERVRSACFQNPFLIIYLLYLYKIVRSKSVASDVQKREWQYGNYLQLCIDKNVQNSALSCRSARSLARVASQGLFPVSVPGRDAQRYRDTRGGNELSCNFTGGKRPFSLKAPISAFTLKNLLRHYSI